MSKYDQLKTLFKQLNSKNIVYNKAYYKLLGSVQGAVLLSHLLYLSSEVFNSSEFYQTDAQLSESLGFSEKTLRTAKSKIKKYVTVTKRGLPAKNHWLVDEELIINDLLNLNNVVTSHAENGCTGSGQKGVTVAAEKGGTNNKELHNNKDLKMNKKKYIKSFALLEKMMGELPAQAFEDASTFHNTVFDYLVSYGCKVQSEYFVADRGDGRDGKIDIVFWNENEVIGIELDRESPRQKSIFKLNQIDCGKVILLREGNLKILPEGLDLILSPSKSLESYESKQKNEIETIFEQLWEGYPLKKAKQKALEAFKKVLDGKAAEEAKELLGAIYRGFKAHLEEHNAKQQLKQQGAEIWIPELPHLSTWLNQRRWEDGYQSAADLLATATKKPGILDLNQYFKGR